MQRLLSTLLDIAQVLTVAFGTLVLFPPIEKYQMAPVVIIAILALLSFLIMITIEIIKLQEKTARKKLIKLIDDFIEQSDKDIADNDKDSTTQ